MSDDVARRHAVGATGPGRITIDGVRLAYDDEGAGPPVVCLHAIGHGAGDFAGLRARLRGGQRVIALDWPGQGRSGPDRRPADAARYAELLDRFLAAVGVAEPVLVGNSIGGAAALLHAVGRPGAVRGLVLENPGGLAAADDRLARAVLAAMVAFFAAGVRRAAWFPRAFGAYYRMVLRRRPAAVQRDRIVASAYEIAPVLHEAWQSFARPAADLRGRAARLDCPVLFAWATGDQLVQLRRSLAAIRTIPLARLERFPGGHAAHLECPDAFEESVARLLASLPRALPRSDARVG